MHFEHSERAKEWIGRVKQFMDEHVYPAVPAYEAQQKQGSRWKVIQIVEDLKAKARTEGLWNMFMPPSSGHAKIDDTFEFEGPRLTNLEYAPLAELMGRVKCSIARRPTQATWKCWSATARARRRTSG
jgi:acyl-CoA dehydrogenase